MIEARLRLKDVNARHAFVSVFTGEPGRGKLAGDLVLDRFEWDQFAHRAAREYAAIGTTIDVVIEAAG